MRSKSKLLMAVLFLGALLLSGCSQTAAQSQLAGTEWEVTDMIGFPDDTDVVGTFRLTSGDLFFDDGANIGSVEIEWTETGFLVTESGTSTAVGSPASRRLDSFIAQLDTAVTTTLDDEVLTLTRNDMSIVAEPGTLSSPTR